MGRTLAVLTLIILGISCKLGNAIGKIKSSTGIATTNDTNQPSFGYTPVDPIPTVIDSSLMKEISDSILPNLFPDETMRMAVGTTSGSGYISYGKDALGFKGQRYIVVLDYIKYITVPFPVYVWRDSTQLHVRDLTILNPFASVNDNPSDAEAKYFGLSTIPVYAGVGLRITADLFVLSDTLNLNLFGLGLAASLGKVSGSLVVQTLGISGENISALLPMPSDLNQTTIQNAIVALGSIKAKIYEAKTILSPQVLGFYNNIGGVGSEVASNLISQILNRNITIKQIYLQSSGTSPSTIPSGSQINSSKDTTRISVPSVAQPRAKPVRNVKSH